MTQPDRHTHSFEALVARAKAIRPTFGTRDIEGLYSMCPDYQLFPTQHREKDIAKWCTCAWEERPGVRSRPCTHDCVDVERPDLVGLVIGGGCRARCSPGRHTNHMFIEGRGNE